jgi:hypothetical protein
MQAYALARPAVRFRLHVLKAKSNKADFIYAPKASSNVEDAVLKVIGKDCALQCDWTALESNEFEIHAFLPKPTANGLKIANQGAFISVDSRPILHGRGTIKQVVSAFKDRLRKSNPSLATVKDPFCCMNVICPPGSYDPNIEPAKDDVMFDHSELVLGAVDKLLCSYYPEAAQAMNDVETPTSAQRPFVPASDDLPVQGEASFALPEERSESSRQPTPEPRSDQPRWRSSMYGIDEDDLEHMQENQPPTIEEEEGSRSAAVSNPWTIARMNTSIKPRISTTQHQLLSPAKSHSEASIQPSSPVAVTTPIRLSSSRPLTPKSSSRMNVIRSSLDDELERSIRCLPQHTSSTSTATDLNIGPTVAADQRERSLAFSEASRPPGPQHNTGLPGRSRAVVEQTSFSEMPQFQPPISQSNMALLTSPASRTPQKRKAGRPKTAATEALNDAWFGQPMRGSEASYSTRRPKPRPEPALPLLSKDTVSSLRRPVLAVADRSVEHRWHSKNNTDVRDFFGQHAGHQINQSSVLVACSSFTAINRPSVSSQYRAQSSLNAVGDSYFNGHTQHTDPFNSFSRASSAESCPSLTRGSEQSLNNSEHENAFQSPIDHLRAHATRERSLSQPLSSRAASFDLPLLSSRIQEASSIPGNNGILSPHNTSSHLQGYENIHSHSMISRPASAGGERLSLIPKRSQEVKTALDLYGRDKLSVNPSDMAAHFKAYQDRELACMSRSASLTRRQAPRIAPAYETATTSSQKRPRTANCAQRTKSSKLPLERVPHGYHLQDSVLSVRMSVQFIVQSSRKLDMARNSLDWGYPAEGFYDAFAEPVTASKVMEWVIRLDTVLHERCKRMLGADTSSLLHEGIQRGLDARKGDTEIQSVEIIEVQVPEHNEDVVSKADSSVEFVSPSAPRSMPNTEDVMSDFDLSQFVDFDVHQTNDGNVLAKEAAKKADDDFGDGIADDMLLDL